MKFDLFIGISLYNTTTLLKPQIYNLKRAIKNSGLNVCLSFFNDGSCEESKLEMEKICKSENVPLYSYPHKGFGYITKQICDFGAQQANWILLLDSDIFLPSYFLRSACQLISLSNNNTGVFSYKSIKIHLVDVYRIINSESHLYDMDAFDGEFILPEPTTQLASYTFLFESKKYKEVGGYCSEYKCYYSDSDFCCRLLNNGYFSYRIHFPKVFHLEHFTTMDLKNKLNLREIRENDMATFKKIWGDLPVMVEEKLFKKQKRIQ